jgi:hypothetical protein
MRPFWVLIADFVLGSRVQGVKIASRSGHMENGRWEDRE